MNRKVLYLIDGLGAGGAERSLSELLPSLPPAGITPVIACLYHRSEGVEKQILASGTEVVFLDRSALRRVRQLRQLLRTEAPDLVHTTLFASSVLGRLARLGMRMPLLTSLVNISYDPLRLGHLDHMKTQVVRLVDGWTGRLLTDHFHAITEAVKAAAIRDLHLPADRITVVPRGRNPARLGHQSPERRARSRADLGLAPDDEVVVSVGRHEAQKAHVHLIEATSLLLATRPRLRLLLAGRHGKTTAILQKMQERLPPGRVSLLGHRDDIGDVLAAADVFAFPSLYEGLGGAVIEAMSLGLPVVASDIPAMREITEPGGSALLVPPADPAALAGALARVLDDATLRRQFADRGRVLFEQRFTIDRSTSGMVALYERLWSGNGKEGPRRALFS